MRYNKALITILVALALSGIVSCAKPPSAELEAASASLSKAETDADTRLYAPDSLARVRDIVKRMQAEVDAKRYPAAKALALEVVSASEEAMREGAAGKAKAKTEASTALDAAKTALLEARTAFDAAIKLRRLDLDVPLADRAIEDAASSIISAESDFAASGFRESLTKAKASRAALATVQQRIADAIRAASAKK
ncbi:MAG: hypothetical protein RBT62_06440 [Spirochaetia bacterium]|jgi:hypothetical protein|nr:hypothetical protein [Spirochaetia bacterium]